MTFITNYYYDLPLDMIEYINHIKQQLEREYVVDEVFIYKGNKCKITKVNDKTYSYCVFDKVREPMVFVKGNTRKESYYMDEHTWTNNVVKETFALKKTLENKGVKGDVISEVYTIPSTQYYYDTEDDENVNAYPELYYFIIDKYIREGLGYHKSCLINEEDVKTYYRYD